MKKNKKNCEIENLPQNSCLQAWYNTTIKSVILLVKPTVCMGVSSQHWNSESVPRSETFLSTRSGHLRLLLPPPCPPASTSPGEGLPGGLLEGACGRRKRRSTPNFQRRRHVCAAITAASEHENATVLITHSDEVGARGFACCCIYKMKK